MNDRRKTKSQLVEELQQLRERLRMHGYAAGNGTAAEQLHDRHTMSQAADTEPVPVDCWELDLSQNTRTYRDAWIRHMGYEDGEVARTIQAMQSLIHPDDRQRVSDTLDACRSGAAETFRVSYRFRKKDGNYVWVTSQGYTVSRDEAGRPVRLIGTTSENTPREPSAGALDETDAYYRNLFENSMMGIVQTQPDGRIIRANATYAGMFGYENFDEMRAAVEDVGAHLYVHPDDRVYVLEMLETQGYMPPKEFAVRKKDGTVFTVLAGAREIRDAQGKLRCYQAEMIDVSPLKDAEQSLARANENLLKAQHIGHIGNWVWDIRHNTLSWSAEIYRIFGVDSEFELSYDNIESMIVPEDRPKNTAHVQRLLDGTADHTSYEFRIMRPDGSCVHIQQNIELMKVDGTAAEICGTMQDVTERNRIENALQERERILNETGKMARIGGWEHDLATGEAVWTEALHDIIGIPYDRKPPGVREHLSYYPEHERQILKDAYQNAVNNGVPFDIELPVYTAGEKRIWCRVQGSPVYENGVCVKMRGTFQDITERKQAERAIYESEEKFRRVFNASSNLMMLIDIEAESIIDVNKAYSDVLGYTRDDVIAQPGKLGFTIRDARQRKRLLGILNDEDRFQDVETMLVTKDGEEVSGLLFAAPIDIQDRHLHIINIIDITGRKNAETELRKQTEFLQAIFDHSLNTIVVTDDAGRYISVNRAAETLFGYSTDDMLHMNVGDLRTALPPNAGKMFQQYLEKGSESGEFAFVSKAGEEKIADYHAVRIATDFNLSILSDITHRKQIESALSESEQVMRYIIKYDPNALAVYDKNLRYIAVSDRYIADYNVGAQDIIGKHHYEVFPEMPERWKRIHQRVLDGAIEKNDDDYFTRPDGSITYNRWECRPWYRSDGSIGGMITYTEVTTERKLAELALRESEERHRLLFENASLGIVYFALDGRIIACNQAAAENMSGTPEEFTGRSIAELFGPEISAIYLERLNQAASQPDALTFESKISLSSVDRWFHSVYHRIVDASGAVIGVQVISDDITERKKAEIALRNISKFPDEDPYPVLRLTYAGDVLYANKSGSMLLDTMLGSKTKRVKRIWVESVRASVVSGRIERREIEVKGRVFSLSFVPIEDQQYINIYGADITRLKQAQEELRTVAASIQDAREKERLGIARELHDEIGQMLTGIKMDIAQCRHLIPDVNDSIESHIRSLQHMTDQAIESVRRISSDLRPMILDDFGLFAAIEWYVEQFQQRSGIACKLVLPEEDVTIDERLSVALYRIVQETLTNVARHAGATSVDIMVMLRKHDLVISIKDNGCGISVSQIRNTKSLGIMGIRERVSEFDGTLEITGTENKGTYVLITIPHAIQ